MLSQRGVHDKKGPLIDKEDLRSNVVVQWRFYVIGRCKVKRQVWQNFRIAILYDTEWYNSIGLNVHKMNILVNEDRMEVTVL